METRSQKSGASSQEKDPNILFPVQLEIFHCPACDGALPQHHVFNHYSATNAASQRTVTVFCEHCNAAWRRRFVCNNGPWQPDGDVERIRSLSELGRIRRKVAQVNNDRVTALSA